MIECTSEGNYLENYDIRKKDKESDPDLRLILELKAADHRPLWKEITRYGLLKRALVNEEYS